MELFRRRYLCLVSFVFLLSAFLLTLFSGVGKIIIGAAAIVGVIISAVFTIILKKEKFIPLLCGALCFAVAVSAFSSFMFISIPDSQAYSAVGENTVWVRVINPTGEEKYDVRLLRVGDKYVSIKSELYIDGVNDLEYGDELVFNAEIDRAMDKSDKSKLLSLTLSDDDRVFIRKAEKKNYFSIDGILSLSHDMQDAFSDHIDRVFGDHAAIAKGLLVNDTRDIDVRTDTAFKRSGTSHILAVSGMHISLLMGALDLVLRSIRVKKIIRIAVISIVALFFLALAAFAASAVRSVIMLYAVYLCYILYEDSDAQTSLFISISLIVLFSPYSVYDIGMWMSFLATLGLLVVYPQFSEKMPYPKHKNRFIRYSLRVLVWCAKTLMITVVANFFLLPIMWYFFGSISISALPCNLVLSPIVTVLMPLCAITAIVGVIPYVGIPFVFASNKLIDLMMAIVNYFAEVRFGVVSLQFEFASVLVVLFVIVFSVLLVIKLKHKSMIFIPMGAFVLSFALCLTVFSATARPELKCVRARGASTVFVLNGTECSVIDIDENNHSKGMTILNGMSKYATEIDEYVIVYPSEKDVKTLETVCKNTVVRKVIIPKFLENKDLPIYYDIFKCAEKYNIKIELFDRGGDIVITENVRFCYTDENEIFVGNNNAYLATKDEELIYAYGDHSAVIPNEDRTYKKLPLN